MSTGCWENIQKKKKKAGGEEGGEDMRMGVEGPKRQAYDKGKIRGRSSLASSCSSWAVSQKKELFLTDVSESAVISQCSIWQVLSLKLEGVEENQPCGVRNGVLQDLFFLEQLRGLEVQF